MHHSGASSSSSTHHHHHHHQHHHHSGHHHSGHHTSNGNGGGSSTTTTSLLQQLASTAHQNGSIAGGSSLPANLNGLGNQPATKMQTTTPAPPPYGQQTHVLIAAHHSNSLTNLSNYDDSSLKQREQREQQEKMPWYEIEIKGLVKNISPKLWTWTHLKYLYMNDNNLMRLPPIVANLVNLQCLDASNNKIRTLPSEIGDMTSLRELYLNNNQIRVLPFEFGKLFKLAQLGLKGNPLTQDMMSIFMEPNGTQKLLIHLLDQLTITCPPPPRRPWMILAEPSQNGNTTIFTTMCYNVLCDKYATRQFYGYCPAWALTWDYRKKLILDDIKNFNADVIALQELETEQFYNYFLPELRQYDYDGIFSPKSRAKTMAEQDKKHVDGCAIFFKTSRFSLVKDYLVEFNQIAMATAEGSEDMLNRVMTKDNIGLAALLEVKQEDPDLKSSPSNGKDNGSTPVNNKQMLLVCTAHIHWDPDYCDVKLIQTLMFTNEIKLIIEQATREFRAHTLAPNQVADSANTIPVVICADLNSLPDSGVIEYLRTGRIHANHIDFKELGYDSCLQKINTSEKPSELSHNLKLECAYEKEIMPYTNYTYDFKGMIDYIFYSRQLMRTVGLLGPLDMDWIKSNKIVGFPHPHVPSDHLPLMVELELFNNNNTMNSHVNSQQQAIGGSQHHLAPTHYQSSTSSSSSNSLRTNQQHSHHNNNNNNHHHHSSSHNNNSHSSSHHNNSNSGSSSSNNHPSASIGQMIPINSSSTSNSNNNNSSGNFNFNFLHPNNLKNK